MALVKGVLRTETVFASAPASAGRIPPAYSSVPQFPPSFLEGRGRGRRKEKAATQLLLRGGRRRREVRGEGGGRRGKRPFVNFCFSSSPPPLLRLLLLLLLPGSQFSVSRKGKQGKSEVSSPSSPQPDKKRKKRAGKSLSFLYSHGTAAKTPGPSSSQTPRRRSSATRLPLLHTGVFVFRCKFSHFPEVETLLLSDTPSY